MRKANKIILGLFIFINIFTINVCAKDLSYIEEILISLGINKNYSENIVAYLENIDISKLQIEKIEDNINNIKEFIEDYENKETMNFFKYYTVYGDVMNLASVLNLDLDLDLNSSSIRLIDKKNEDTLFEGDINSLMQIYSNYKDSNYKIDIEEVFENISLSNEEIRGIEEVNNSKNSYHNEIDNELSTEQNISNNENATDIDEYIDKLQKYNESLSVNNKDMLELKIIMVTIGIVTLILIIYKIIRVKKLQKS